MGEVWGKKAIKIPDFEKLVFIAHFLNFSKEEIYNMSFDEINIWFEEAYNLWRKLKKLNDSK